MAAVQPEVSLTLLVGVINEIQKVLLGFSRTPDSNEVVLIPSRDSRPHFRGNVAIKPEVNLTTIERVRFGYFRLSAAILYLRGLDDVGNDWQ
jgi:hypothetical protein